MAIGTYPPSVPLQYFDNAGLPLAGGTIETFIAGTTTHLATYSDVNLTIPNLNPMTLDASGRPPAGNIFLNPGSSYKWLIKDAMGAIMATPDNILAIPISSTNLEVIGTLGETVALNNLLYISDGSDAGPAGSWRLTTPTVGLGNVTPIIGFALAGGTTGNTVPIRIAGRMTGLSGLIPGQRYFAGNIGAFSLVPPIPPVGTVQVYTGRFVGQADSTTTMVIAPNPPLNQTIGIQEFIVTGTPNTCTIDASQGQTFYIFGNDLPTATIRAPLNPRQGQYIVLQLRSLTTPTLFTLDTGFNGFLFGTTVPGPLTATASGCDDFVTCVYQVGSRGASDVPHIWCVLSVSKGFLVGGLP